MLLSDGGDTSAAAERAAADAGVPVYPIAVGAANVPGDQEVLSVTAADPVLDDARVDIAVTAVSHGAEKVPLELRLLENGRSIEVARVAAGAPGTPVRHVFRASPPAGAPTVYTVEIPAAAGDPVPENNTRSVLVPAPSRPRRILLVEGAPGFEHGFLVRALAADQGLAVDASIRKGKDEQRREHLLRAGGAVPQRRAGERISANRRRPQRLRRHRAGERGGGDVLDRADRGDASLRLASAAAASWCSARRPSGARVCWAARSRMRCRCS